MKTRSLVASLFAVAAATLSLASASHAASIVNPIPIITVPAAQADLVPIADPTTHMWTYITNNGGTTYLRIAVLNQGQADAGPFHVSLTFYNSQGQIPATVTVPFNAGLKKGFFGYQLVPVPNGWGAGPNKNKLKFVEAVDSGDVVPEPNELNNFQLVYALPYSTTPQ